MAVALLILRQILDFRMKMEVMAVALLILRQILDFRMKMGGRQVEMKVSSYISEHHSLYKISSLKAKKY